MAEQNLVLSGRTAWVISPGLSLPDCEHEHIIELGYMLTVRIVTINTLGKFLKRAHYQCLTLSDS